MGRRAGDADGDRRVLGDAACGDRGGGRASGSATAWAMRKEMSRLSSGVFFGFGCFTGSGVLRPMAASRAAARHRQPRAALATNSQRCRVGRVREALVCLFLRVVCGPGFSEPGFAVGRFRTQGTACRSLPSVALLVVAYCSTHLADLI